MLGGGTPEVRALAREAGLAVHAWLWTLCRGDLVDALPHCFAVSREGRSTREHPPYVDYYRFLCPSRPEVAAHLEREVTALAAEPDLAGVHLDYVRFPDVILPRGLWGRAYWWALVPFHSVIFPIMLRRIVAAAASASEPT